MSSPPKDVPAPPSEAVRNGITTRCSATLLDYASSAASGKRALVLIREGILRPGDSLLCGTCAGRVHRLWATEHDGGKEVDCAGPGQAVVIQCRVAHNIAGELGQPIHFMDDELAQRAAEVRKIQLALPNYERLAAPVGEGNVHAGEEEKGGSPSVVYIKADSANSLASILDALDETHLSASSATQIMSYGIGVVNPADITTAAMARATIFSFNVGCEGDARAIARSKGVPIKQFNSLPAMVDALCAAT
jgi:translation initiation factor IF-2